MDELSRAYAEVLDEHDPLAGFRERFVIAGDETIYLDGDSLGRLPLSTRERLHAAIDEWGTRLVGGWDDWIDLPLQAGDAIAPLIGAQAGEVLVGESTTVNLYKLAGAALDAFRHRVVAVAETEFPTDRYILEGLAAQRGVELRHDAGDVEDALLVRSLVDYRTGELAELRERPGCTTIWDVSHAVGAVEIDLGAAGAQLAVGCTYKYLNAGPGAPAFLYVAQALQGRLRSPIWGWMGQRDLFSMERSYDPEPDIRRFMAGSPTIIPLVAVEEGARITAEAGIGALRAKSLAQTELLVALHDAWLAPLGFELATPRDGTRRGSHVTLRHADGWRICRALIERAAVIPDFRRPDAIRLGVAPLYTRYVDIWDALDRLRRLVAAGEHELVDDTPARIT
jgi:kynureninase